MLTLANIQTSSFQTASGYCTNSQEFLDLANQVIPRLLKRGDWPGTLLPIRVQVRNGCVCWPRYVGQVRKLDSCRGSIPVLSVWYEFLDYHGSRHIHGWEAWRGHERRMINQFQSPVYNDIYGPNCYVRLYCDLPVDVGTSCTVFGIDNNGQRLQTNNGNGTFSDGATFTVQQQAGPGGNAYWGSTNTPVSHIDRIVVGATQGTKRLYSWDTVQSALFDLAVYDPSETNPSYVRQQLEGSNRGQWGGGCCTEAVISLVKLKFIPVSAPSDGLIFLEGAQGALLHGFRAVKREEASDAAGAKGFWALAIEELNRMAEDFQPEDQFAAQNNIFGTATISNRCF